MVESHSRKGKEDKEDYLRTGRDVGGGEEGKE